MATQLARDALKTDDNRYADIFAVEVATITHGVERDRSYADLWESLRVHGPVAKGGPRDFAGLPGHVGATLVEREDWSFMSYHAVERGFRENLTFSSEIQLESTGLHHIGSTMINMIGKQHKSYRSVAQPVFIRPRVMDWWKRRWVDETLAVLFERLEGRRSADLNLELCARMPMHVITRAIGLSSNDEVDLREHLARSTFGRHRSTPEAVEHSQREVSRVVHELIALRRAEPREDVISVVIGNDLSLPDGTRRKLTDGEIFSFAKLLIFAGGGTTWRQLAMVLDLMLGHYEVWEECRANRALIEQTVDEAIRLRATVTDFPRVTTRDVEVEGVTVPEGARVHLLLGLANHDPSVFDRPQTFDIHRKRVANLGFGIGPHRCIGMDVAKQEMIGAINGLMDRWPNLRLDSGAPRPVMIGFETRGMSAVPVLLEK
jgi:cytochrome P450